MLDVVIGVMIVAGIYLALRYIRSGKHCAHNCGECRHPCKVRV